MTIWREFLINRRFGRFFIGAKWAALGFLAWVFISSAHSATSEQKANQAVIQGIELYRKGNLMAARSQFRRALRYQPQDQKAKLYLGRIDQKIRKTAESLLNFAEKTRMKSEKELERILHKYPEGPEAARLLYRSMEDVVKESTAPATMEDLIWILERPAPLGDSMPKTHRRQELLRKNLLEDRDRRVYATVNALLDRGRWEEAIQLLESVLANQPGNASAAELIKKVRSRYAKELTERIEGLYSQAADLYAKAEYGQAADLLREILRIQPLHMEAARYLEKIQTLQKESEPGEVVPE